MCSIEVITPVVNIEMFCTFLFNSICNNVLLPKKVIIINNSTIKDNSLFIAKMDEYIIDNTLNIEVYNSKTNFVNESFNVGISNLSENCEYVAFLNEDIVLNTQFFQKSLEVFNIENCGVACPNTVHLLNLVCNEKNNIYVMSKREGWAFTIKKSLLDKIPSIPSDRVSIFFGDDWFWYHILFKGFLWYKNTGNTIYHKIGVSGNPKFKNILKEERVEFKNIMKEQGWNI